MKKKIILAISLMGIVLLGFVGYPYYQLHFKTLQIDNDIIFYIPTGADFNEVSEIIDSEKILDKKTFVDYAEKFELNDRNIEPGKYKASKGMKIKNLIYGLKNGNQEIKDVVITFNNCEDIEDVAGMVSKFIEADSAAIVNYVKDTKTIEKYGFTNATMMSLFMPDSYEIGEYDIDEKEFVEFMADQWKTFWNEERTSKRKAIGLSESEVTTLASILEAEQGIFSQEWQTIAGLYLNRLELGMRLQSDPTAKFCWGDELDGVQRLLEKHMQKDCPYNTYLYAGLPPGPIRIPSKKAIDAVLNAEEHDYLYFCAKADNSGLHAFAETYAQHLENARKFWTYMDSRGN